MNFFIAKFHWRGTGIKTTQKPLGLSDSWQHLNRLSICWYFLLSLTNTKQIQIAIWWWDEQGCLKKGGTSQNNTQPLGQSRSLQIATVDKKGAQVKTPWSWHCWLDWQGEHFKERQLCQWTDRSKVVCTQIISSTSAHLGRTSPPPPSSSSSSHYSSRFPWHFSSAHSLEPSQSISLALCSTLACFVSPLLTIPQISHF